MPQKQELPVLNVSDLQKESGGIPHVRHDVTLHYERLLTRPSNMSEQHDVVAVLFTKTTLYPGSSVYISLF